MTSIPPPNQAPKTQPQTNNINANSSNAGKYIAVGCVTTLVLFAFMIWGLFHLMSQSIRSNGAYTQAMQRLKHDAKSQELLGTPIQDKGTIAVRFNTSMGTRNVHFRIAVAGSKTNGILEIRATRSPNQNTWKFFVLQLSTKAQTHSLLPSSSSTPTSQPLQLPLKAKPL